MRPRKRDLQAPAQDLEFVAKRDRARRVVDTFDRFAILPLRTLLGIWVSMVIVCGLTYWLADRIVGYGLRSSLGAVPGDAEGLLTALYFSIVTATSIGYGDVVPVGVVRLVAVAEGAAGLLLFGVLVSKFVSRRQEVLIEEIHQTTFEERLGRLRTNLHLVLSELQRLTEICSGSAPSPRVLVRIESAGAVLVGELRSIHDLLYRAEAVPDEHVLEAILANVAACLEEFGSLLDCLASATLTRTLRREIESMARLANEICGDCVPRQYAPELRAWMDHVQAAARRLAA